MNDSLPQRLTDSLTGHFSQSLLHPLPEYITSHNKLTFPTSTRTYNILMAGWASSLMACFRAFMAARSLFRALAGTSLYWGCTVWSGIIWKIFQVGGSTRAVGDLGGGVRAFEWHYRVWMTCLLSVLGPYEVDGLTAW
jgi:hypothetical protein